MERLVFKDYKEFVNDVTTRYNELKKLDELDDISVIAKYDDVKQILKELLKHDYNLEDIDLKNSEYNDYKDEYVLTLLEDGIWLEPIMRDGGYLMCYASVIYLLDNCSSRVIPYCEGEIVYEVGIGEEETQEKCTCGKCECVKRETKSKSTANEHFLVNGKPVTKDEFREELDGFMNKYTNNLRDVLGVFSNTMDEFVKLQKKFW